MRQMVYPTLERYGKSPFEEGGVQAFQGGRPDIFLRYGLAPLERKRIVGFAVARHSLLGAVVSDIIARWTGYLADFPAAHHQPASSHFKGGHSAEHQL